jgi:hypothetical protein
MSVMLNTAKYFGTRESLSLKKPFMPAQAGIQVLQNVLGPRVRGDGIN